MIFFTASFDSLLKYLETYILPTAYSIVSSTKLEHISELEGRELVPFKVF
jgi:hypothetical protein